MAGAPYTRSGRPTGRHTGKSTSVTDTSIDITVLGFTVKKRKVKDIIP